MIQTVCGCPARYPLVLTDDAVGQEIVCPVSNMSFRVSRARPFGAAEWETCPNPELMHQCLLLLGYRAPPRKRRLLICADCRRHWAHFTDERSRRAVAVAESYADGATDRRQLRLAWMAAREAAEGQPLAPSGLNWAHIAAACAEEPVARAWPFRDLEAAGGDILVELARDLLGNPFRPLSPRPFPAGVVGLARECHEGDHALYPVLADALADLGEDGAADHCRRPDHVRGCHVVDWILGRG